jgi:hypothetical protein
MNPPAADHETGDPLAVRYGTESSRKSGVLGC